MKLAPLAPIREQERIQLYFLALHWARNRFQARLLPPAAALAIAKHFIAANHAGVFKMELFALRFGPKHEGRVAVRSPRDGDRAGWELVLHQSMLGKDSGWISLSDLAVGNADHAIAVAHESGLGGRDEFRMLDGSVRQPRFRRSLKRKTRARREQCGSGHSVGL